MERTSLPPRLQKLFSLDTFRPKPTIKLALHVSIGILLLPCIICGIVRLGGGGSTNVVGQVSTFPLPPPTPQTVAFPFLLTRLLSLLSRVYLIPDNTPQSLKSLTFLLYIALTERVPRFHRWASTRAYAWLTASEILFWIVTFGLSAKGAGSHCEGSEYVAGYVLVVLTLVLE